jgi:LacI family transcriptional regulator
MRPAHISKVIGRRTRRTAIAVSTMPNADVADRLLELADDHHWQLIGLAGYLGDLPADVAVAGALVAEPPTSPLVRQLIDRRVPTVRLGRMPHPLDKSVPAVMSDRSAVGRLAADHFAERAFEHFAFIGHPTWTYYRAFYRGLADGARELGCTPHLRRMHGEIQTKARKTTAARWRIQQEDFTRSLLKFPRPVGLLATSDRTAVRYIRWIAEAGLRVPEDVAVLGIGNDRFLCKAAPVAVSSIAHHWHRIIDTAVDMLNRQMAGESLDSTTVEVRPRGVVTRRSTDVLAAGDDNVVRALRFMWNHIDEDLSVDQIARAVDVSRRTLERAFERELGRGVFAEFQRRRLDRACEMLIQTDLTIAEVAGALGFSSQNYFGQVFRKAFGTSPGRYRAQNR